MGMTVSPGCQEPNLSKKIPIYVFGLPPPASFHMQKLTLCEAFNDLNSDHRSQGFTRDNGR